MAMLLILSCKKEISINIDDKPAILVVNAELDADSLMRFNLSLTQNITDNGGVPQVNDAVVEVLSGDSQILSVLDNQGKGLYSSAWLKPKAGTRYLFRITRGSGEYWVDEQMPDSFKADVLDTGRIVFQGKSGFYQFHIRFKDDVLRSNYYGLRLKRIFEKYSGSDTIVTEEWVNIESIDFILTENPESKFSKKHLVFRDTYCNGLNQELRFGAAGLFGRTDQKTLGLVLYTASYSESAYAYYSSVNEHMFFQNDPFSQPTLLRGNVSNAFGAVVGRFTQTYAISFP